MTDFDPVQHSKAIRERPQDFVSMVSIATASMAMKGIRGAKTIEALKKAYSGPATAAKKSGDTDLLKLLTEAKDTRKKELTI